MGKGYKVEDVLAEKVVNGKMHYRIKWEGYGSQYNSWEVEENLSKDLIEFWLGKKKER